MTKEEREKFDLLLSANVAVTPDPLETLPWYVVGGSAYNYTGYENPEVTDLVNQALATFDVKEKAGLVVRIQDAFEKQYLLTTLVSKNSTMFLDDRFGGAVTSSAYLTGPSLALIGQK